MTRPPLPRHNRYDFIPLNERKDYDWPGGARLVMNISVHPHVFGQPFRVRMLRAAMKHCLEGPHHSKLWLARPGEIADYWYSLPAGTIPGSA